MRYTGLGAHGHHRPGRHRDGVRQAALDRCRVRKLKASACPLSGKGHDSLLFSRPVFEAGDYVYERNGMIHESTTALEDTEYLFICDGPVLFYDENGFTGYLGWEELERQALEYARKSKAA